MKVSSSAAISCEHKAMIRTQEINRFKVSLQYHMTEACNYHYYFAVYGDILKCT